MIKTRNIHSVTDFTRKAKQYIHRLKKTGDPEILTVNGEAQIVVQSADAYQKLLDRAERADLYPILQKSIAEAKRGEGRSARVALREIAASVGVKID